MPPHLEGFALPPPPLGVPPLGEALCLLGPLLGKGLGLLQLLLEPGGLLGGDLLRRPAHRSAAVGAAIGAAIGVSAVLVLGRVRLWSEPAPGEAGGLEEGQVRQPVPRGDGEDHPGLVLAVVHGVGRPPAASSSALLPLPPAVGHACQAALSPDLPPVLQHELRRLHAERDGADDGVLDVPGLDGPLEAPQVMHDLGRGGQEGRIDGGRVLLFVVVVVVLLFFVFLLLFFVFLFVRVILLFHGILLVPLSPVAGEVSELPKELERDPPPLLLAAGGAGQAVPVAVLVPAAAAAAGGAPLPPAPAAGPDGAPPRSSPRRGPGRFRIDLDDVLPRQGAPCPGPLRQGGWLEALLCRGRRRRRSSSSSSGGGGPPPVLGPAGRNGDGGCTSASASRPRSRPRSRSSRQSGPGGRLLGGNVRSSQVRGGMGGVVPWCPWQIATSAAGVASAAAASALPAGGPPPPPLPLPDRPPQPGREGVVLCPQAPLGQQLRCRHQQEAGQQARLRRRRPGCGCGCGCGCGY